jgi:GntP family gluconate:H+ symporter
MYHVLLLVFAVVLLLFLISKVKLHTFLSLLVISLFLGVAGGVPLNEVAIDVAAGFGGIMTNIGIVIVCGVVIGEILEHTGAAKKIAHAVLKLIGSKRATAATAVTGGIVSIPVFCDTGFVILNPAIRALSRAGKVPYMCLVSALMMGLLATHTLTPPTPGPIAAAGILGADLGIVMLYGLIITIPVIGLTTIWCNSKYLRKKYPDLAPLDNPSLTDEGTTKKVEEKVEKDSGPSVFLSTLPIVVPIILILVRSISNQAIENETTFSNVIDFLGTPYVALLIGVGLSFLLPKKITSEVTETWVSSAINKSAVIVLTTGMAGGFGRILQSIGVGDIIAGFIADTNLPSILLPFILSMLILWAQGSATVALTTAAAIILPLLPALGISPELAVISIAGGAMTGVFPQGSYFWAVTKMAGFDIKKGYVAVTLTTFIMGAVALVSITVLSLFVA